MKVKRLLSITWDIVFYTFIMISLVITISLSRTQNPGDGPSILGYKFYTVLTGSMSPTIGKGYLTIVEEVESSDIKVNDVITFKNTSGHSVTTHRVKEIDTSDGIKFITQGDANNAVDPLPIDGNMVVGKVVNYIPLLGAIFEVIRENLKFIMSILVVIIVIGILPSKGNKEKEFEESGI